MQQDADTSEARFVAYVDELSQVIGHADRTGPLRDYCTGLLMPCERKSVEPMAAMMAPSRVSSEHQSLLHFVGQARWSDEAVLGKVQELVMTIRAVPRKGFTRLAWPVSIAGGSARRTIARLR